MKNQFKSGFVSIIGYPNVGKSTLLNSLVGEKVSIVSDKPQTTRNKISAVLTTEDYQIIFIDTPGVQSPKSKLGEYMEKSVVLDGVDIVIHLVNPRMPTEKELTLVERLKGVRCSVFLSINKTDIVDKRELLSVIDEYSRIYPYNEILPISALKSDNLDGLLLAMERHLPQGPMYYDEDYLTDQPEKLIIAEIIREKALFLLQDEIPHGVHVMVEGMKKRNNRDLIDINAALYCEKDSHKGMIIGKNGSMLKKIGERARKEIEFRLQTPINLQLWVKVKLNWRNSDFYVKNFGYKL